MVNYNKLYYFYIITLRGSMNQAAQQLYISQPALSKSVKDLEAFFGACRGNIAQGMCADFFRGRASAASDAAVSG